MSTREMVSSHLPHSAYIVPRYALLESRWGGEALAIMHDSKPRYLDIINDIKTTLVHRVTLCTNMYEKNYK